MKAITTGLATLLLAASTGAYAQSGSEATQVRLRGTVRLFQAPTLIVATPGDGAVEFDLPAGVGINGVEARSMADIADDAFIGTTAARGADGRWQATEVHIFPESMRGAGEGHYAWDFPETTMTNAAVTGAAATGDGRVLRLTHSDGETEVVVTPDTAIVALVPGDRSLLVPGARVFVLGLAAASGAFTPLAIVAEKDGVEPPM